MSSSSAPSSFARSEFKMLTGFWVSKALMAAVEFDLFTKLAGGRQITLQELQKTLGMERRPLAGPAEIAISYC
ncbi:methyltransferase family protein [Candidatus Nitrososphaera evergladensis]|nr:hypothetical protein [Candidatus Nitrososphaera evergladensis]